MNKLKVISYHNSMNDLPLNLISFLEEHKLDYAIFESNTSGEEIEELLSKILKKEQKNVLFIEPKARTYWLSNEHSWPTAEDNWFSESNYLSYLTDDSGEMIGFYTPVRAEVTDSSLSIMSKYINDSIRRTSASTGDASNENNSNREG